MYVLSPIDVVTMAVADRNHRLLPLGRILPRLYPPANLPVDRSVPV
jgi:hypothetical protein